MDRPIQTSEARNASDFQGLESQIRECFGRVVYSHKTHEKCADLLLTRHNRIKLLQIALSVITTGSLLVTLLGQSRASTIVAAIASAGLLALNSYTKDYDLGQMSQKHKATASDLWDIRESYFSLLTDINSGLTRKEDIVSKRDDLQEKLHAVYEAAPRSIPKAYGKAQEALKVNEELTFSDEEIDKFLPAPLRKKA
jgi:hypothetical protein